MGEFTHYFTLKEARALLPDLRRTLLRIQDLIAEIRARELQEGSDMTVILRGNGTGPILTGTGAQKEEAQNLIKGIALQGIQIKDLQRGLLDFPHFLDADPEHEVFLCWCLGEDTIEYWHEIEGGFDGRQPV